MIISLLHAFTIFVLMNEMRKKGNNRWLYALMIISQIMLTGLVFQWLRSQWQDEKDFLKNDIARLFTESTGQILDSLLVKDLIVPALTDSAYKSGHLIPKSESSPVNRHHESQNFTNASEKRYGSFSDIDSAEKDLLLRSVKLFISRSHNSENGGGQIRHLVTFAPDTSLLKSLFESKIREAGIKINIRWVSGYREEQEYNSGSLFYFESFLLNHPYGAVLGDIRKNILIGIYAQILFSFVLFLVTASAFFFNYRSLKKMETLNTLRDDFISNISHELKTPVSTVSVALEALKNYNSRNDPDRVAEYTDIAFNEMRRLDKLVTQVLNTSILEDQDQFIVPEEVDLGALTREVLNSMQVRFSKQKAKVEFHVKDEACLLNLDKLHIQGVLINILDNSLKYASGNPVIGIKIEQDASSVLLIIKDNGPGIPEKYLSKVFDKFFRVPDGDKHNVKGYGLGLSYAKLVMKYHSGSISVRNIKDGGCEFTLSFPKPSV